MALAAVVCLTACDDTSSSSYEIPTYKSDSSLPDTCSMEVAKVDTAYFACFENKWVEVTDSATVEQLKEGMDEEEIKAKLEELQSLLPKPTDNTPKPTSSSAQSEVEGSDDEEDSSSSSEEEEEYSSSSKKKKNKDKDDSGSGSGEGGSGSGEETVKKCGDETYDPKTQICGEGNKVLSKCGESGYDPETQVCGEGNKVLSKCGESGYDPETQVCGDDDKILGKCGDETFNPETEWCHMTDYKVIAFENTNCCGSKTKACQAYATSGKLGIDASSPYFYDKTKAFCDTREPSTVYKMVTIGTKTWMAENLDYEIANYSHCYKDASQEECKKYGRLYDQSLVVNNPSSICPTGWHLPDNTEWKALVSAHETSAGIKSKEWTGGTNTLGFNLLPAGFYLDGEDKSLGVSSLVWSSNTTSTSAYYLLNTGLAGPFNSDMSVKSISFSVRCVKD